ncbi:alpha/beta hydrolase [Acidovorax sp. LjRoot118]|uniref:alpha/beta hydrolase n=1 Tax=Acidovorax sp. LjRoot118 TaxID=3342256 RepID=UPI003ECD9258
MSAQQLEAILQMAAQNPPPAQASPAQLRAWFDASNSQMPLAQGLAIESLRIPDAAGGSMAAELLGTPQADPRKLVIYYHAGGFVFGSLASHRALCSYLAQFSGARVLNVDYRLAPEHPAPAAHDDAFAAYQWALANGYAASAIALAGDSAGGNLALSTGVRARNQGLALPAAIVALSPALDLASEGESHRTVDDPFITRELMGFFNAMYVPGGDVRSPTVTPFYSAELQGLPPVQLQVGSRERLRDDAVTMAARLKAAGVEVECTVWDGMVHCWQLFAPVLDEALASLEQAGRFMAARQRSSAA